MAQRYRVTTKDNPLTLSKKFGVSPQKLLQTNGLKTLTAGQTIKVPTFGQVGGGIYDPSNPNAGNPFANGSYVREQLAVSGSNEPYRGQPLTQPVNMQNISTGGGGFNAIPVNNRLTQANYQPPQQQLGAQVSNSFQQSAPFLTQSMLPAQPRGSNTVIPPNNGINNGATTPNGGSSNLPPSNTLPANYVYTGGNDPLSVEQRRIWNQQAGGTGDERVFLRTKQDIWNMKANQRRRNSNRGNNASPVPAPEVIQAPNGNAVNTSLSWRVG